MTLALFVVGGLFLLVYGPLAVLAWRRPLLARFAWRESTRRRSQFALLVVGLLVGSASITAAMVGADSTKQTLAFITNQSLGAVDLTVTAAGGRFFPLDFAGKLATDSALMRYVDGVQAGVELPASVSDEDQQLARADVLMVGFDPASQRRFGAYVLSSGGHTYGDDLAPGAVLLSSSLAGALEAKIGDHLQIRTGTTKAVDLQVSGIVTRTGPGAYGDVILAVFMPLKTAQLVTGDDRINVIRVAARGGTAADSEAAHLAAGPLQAAVSRISTETPMLVNQKRLEGAQATEGAAGWVLGTNLGFSGLSVFAGIALIINLVLALAEERRPRLAVMRALGLTRAGLVTFSVLEGAIYSLAAATAGVTVGVLAGLYLASQIWNASVVDSGGRSYLTGVPPQLTVRPGTLALAFAAGALITLGSVAAAAYRTSRMAIAAAVRDLPEPSTPRRNHWLRAAVLVVLVALGTTLLAINDPRTRLVGGVALIVTVTALARDRLSDRARATIAGLLVTVWAGITFAASNTLTSDVGIVVFVLLVGLTIPAIGLSIAAAANLKLIDYALSSVGNRFGLLQATLRPPLAYLSRRPVRTGLATSAFALVLALVTMIAVAVATYANGDYRRNSAGFDIKVVTSGADPILLSSELAREVTAQMAIQQRLYQGPHRNFAGTESSGPVMFYVLPDQSPSAAPVYLISKEKRFTNNSEVWQAVGSDPRLVIAASASGASPGDDLTLRGLPGPVHVHVAAVEAGSVLDGIIASPATVAQIDTVPSGSTVLLKTKPGSDARGLAHWIGRSLFKQGAQAIAIKEILDKDAATNIAYATEYDVLLHMGLLLGVVALAMIGIRAAVERRRVIGILRALGYQPPRLLVGMVAEATLTATIGVAAGVGAGAVVGYFLIPSAAPDATFGVDLPRLGIALAIVYATVVLVTWPLASRAARMAPTEAIRMTG